MARPPHPPPDAIANTVLTAFHALPPKFKPRTLTNGRREWVPLAGIVLARPPPNERFQCVALATGMKCLSYEKVQTANGNVLHDSHAEILALRGFNRWVLDACLALASGQECEWIGWRRGENREGFEMGSGTAGESTFDGVGTGEEQPFELKENVTIHMYASDAPCGDASMELTMRAQADSSPWPTPLPSSDNDLTSAVPPMLGRGHFSHLGIVRRKPSRADAPLALSKSCSDKLALRQCTGLLSALTTSLLHPGGTYLATLTLPTSQVVTEAVTRAFGAEGRMAPVAEFAVQTLWGGYAFRPFEVRGTEVEFGYSKRALGSDAVGSNLCAVATPTRREILVNGVLQGRKAGDPRGASCLSRRRMWEGTKAVCGELGMGKSGGETYEGMKRAKRLEIRERVKADVRDLALKGWVRGTGDEGWGLESSGE